MHTIVVEAIDGQGLSTQQTFLITIEGVGEAPTAIRLSSIVVRENDPGAVIANVVVVDPDILVRIVSKCRIHDSRSPTVSCVNAVVYRSILNRAHSLRSV